MFSHSQTVVLCGSCSTVLCTPTGGRARLTEGECVLRGAVRAWVQLWRGMGQRMDDGMALLCAQISAPFTLGAQTS